MGNERRSPAGDGLDRTTHGFAVADELIQIPCATWDLGNRPITDGGAKRCDIHLLEEVAESGIGWRTRQLDLQCGGQSRVMADGETLEITKALTTAQDAENRHQQQVCSATMKLAGGQWT